MGFETSADSYWTLTKLIVDHFDSKSATNAPGGHDDGVVGASGWKDKQGNSNLDFMPLEVDCDSQGAHLRKILKS